MTRVVPNSPAPATRLGTVFPRRKVHITILAPAFPAAGILLLAKDRDSLESPPPFAAGGARASGTPVENTTGAAEIEWSGDLWGIGDPTNAGPLRIDLDL